MILRGKGQKPVDKTTDRIRVKGDESGGKNANGVGSYSADGWERNVCILSLTRRKTELCFLRIFVSDTSKTHL